MVRPHPFFFVTIIMPSRSTNPALDAVSDKFYRIFLRRQPVFFGLVFVGAIASEYVISNGIDAWWDGRNRGVRLFFTFDLGAQGRTLDQGLCNKASS
jgi:hypothetical protein